MNPYRNIRWFGFLSASLLIHGAVLAWVEFSTGGVSQVSSTLRVMLASAGSDAEQDGDASWRPASATRSRDLFARSEPPASPEPPAAEKIVATVEDISVDALPSVPGAPARKPGLSKNVVSTVDVARPAPALVAEKTTVTLSSSTPTTDIAHADAASTIVGDGDKSLSDAASTASASSALANASVNRDRSAAANNGELLALLHLAIDRSKRYPSLARRQRREGTATVRFRLSPSGKVDAIDIDRSSGARVLDTAAISAVSRVAPFAPARTLLSEVTRFKVDVTFRLN